MIVRKRQTVKALAGPAGREKAQRGEFAGEVIGLPTDARRAKAGTGTGTFLLFGLALSVVTSVGAAAVVAVVLVRATERSTS
jgi:hypothetical protein